MGNQLIRLFWSIQGGQQFLAQLLECGGCRRAGGREGLEPLGVPAVEGFPRPSLHVGHMDLNGFTLADAVQTAYALFQQVGVQGQVEQDQVMGELEIAALAADLGAQQGLAAFFRVGEEGC